MKQIFILIIGIFILVSCDKKKTTYTETTFLQFRPRICDRIATIPLKIYNNYPYGLGTESVKANDFYFGLHTGDRYLDSAKAFFKNYRDLRFNPTWLMLNYLDSKNGLAESNPSLEAELNKDFSNQPRSTHSGPAGNVMPWPYRTTGVKNLSIVAMNTFLGKPAGTSLNEHFTIEQFEPKQIINFQTKHLIWGYKDKTKVSTIDQWLSLHPMAQPYMYFKLNGQPPEVPATVKFIVTLQTENDLVLRDTLAVNFLAN